MLQNRPEALNGVRVNDAVEIPAMVVLDRTVGQMLGIIRYGG